MRMYMVMDESFAQTTVPETGYAGSHNLTRWKVPWMRKC